MTVSETDADAPPEGVDRASAAARWTGRWPRRLWLLVALQALLMLGTTVLYPAFQNPDEYAHVDYVIAHRDGQWFDGPGQRQFQSGVVKADSLVPNIQWRLHVAQPPLARSARASFDALGTAPQNAERTNQMVQHPPLYYGLAVGYSFLIPHFSQQPFDWQVFWLRFLSMLLLLPVPLLIFGTARRIGGSQNLALLAALIPLSIPTYLRTGASVTNDSLLVLVCTVLLALLVRVAWGDLSRRTAIWVGLVWSAALLTKGFALALPPAIVLAYLLGARGGLAERVRTAWRPAAGSGGIGAALGGWWWVRNLSVYGAVQPQGFGDISDTLRQTTFGRDRPGGTDVAFFKSFVLLLAQRGWGSIGLLDNPGLDNRLLWSMSGIFVLVLVFGLVVAVRPLRDRFAMSMPNRWNLGRAVLLVPPTMLILGVPYVGSRTAYLQGQQLAGIQIRYLLPALLGQVLLAAVALHVMARRLDRWLAPVLLTGAVVFLALSPNEVLDLEMSSSSPSYQIRMGDAFRFVVGWAPFPTALAVCLLILTVVVTLVGLVAFWAAALRQPRRSYRPEWEQIHALRPSAPGVAGVAGDVAD
jgi:4-amino-4-deoxy-L-arabinose transferase-like glycosyltransferase